VALNLQPHRVSDRNIDAAMLGCSRWIIADLPSRALPEGQIPCRSILVELLENCSKG
jgi:hypothetical protein